MLDETTMSIVPTGIKIFADFSDQKSIPVFVCQAFTDGRRDPLSFRCILTNSQGVQVVDIMGVEQEPDKWIKNTRSLYLPGFSKEKNSMFGNSRPITVENDFLIITDKISKDGLVRTYTFDLRYTSIFPVQLRSFRRYGPYEAIVAFPEEDVCLGGDYVIRKY